LFWCPFEPPFRPLRLPDSARPLSPLARGPKHPCRLLPIRGSGLPRPPSASAALFPGCGGVWGSDALPPITPASVGPSNHSEESQGCGFWHTLLTDSPSMGQPSFLFYVSLPRWGNYTPPPSNGGGGPRALIPTPPLAGGQVNKWQDGRLNTRREFRRTVRWPVRLYAPKGEEVPPPAGVCGGGAGIPGGPGGGPWPLHRSPPHRRHRGLPLQLRARGSRPPAIPRTHRATHGMPIRKAGALDGSNAMGRKEDTHKQHKNL